MLNGKVYVTNEVYLMHKNVMNLLKSFSRGKEKLKNSASNLVHNVKNSLKEQVTKTIDSVKQSSFVQEVSESLNEKIWNLVVTDENRFDFEENHYSILGNEPDYIRETKTKDTTIETTVEPTEEATEEINEKLAEIVPISQARNAASKKASAYMFSGVLKAQRLKESSESSQAKRALQEKCGTQEKYDKSLRAMELRSMIASIELEIKNLQDQNLESGLKQLSTTPIPLRNGKRVDFFGQLAELQSELRELESEDLLTSSDEFIELTLQALSQFNAQETLDKNSEREFEEYLKDEEKKRLAFLKVQSKKTVEKGNTPYSADYIAHHVNSQIDFLKNAYQETGFRRNLEGIESEKDRISHFLDMLSDLPVFANASGRETLVQTITVKGDQLQDTLQIQLGTTDETLEIQSN